MEDVKNLIGKDVKIIKQSNAFAHIVHKKMDVLPWNRPVPFEELEGEKKLIDNLYIKRFSDTGLSMDKMLTIVDAIVLDYLPHDTKNDPESDRVVLITFNISSGFYYRLDNFKINNRIFNPADPYNEEIWEED